MKKMIRKVIQLAGKTSVVSLPLKWVQKNNISKGEELEVLDKGNRLIVNKIGLKPEDLKITLDINNKHIFDKRYIADLYKRGYDEIYIKYPKIDLASEIKKSNLLGYEIVDQGKEFCTIKNVSVGLESEFDTMLRRSFRLAKEMALNLEEYFSGKKVNLEEIRDLEALNNKFTDFCLRLLNKNGYVQNHKTTFLYVIVRELESIADIFKYIVDDIRDNKENASPKVIKYFIKSKNFFETFYELFYKFDKEKFSKFYNIRKGLILEGRQLIKEKGLDGLIAHHSLNLIIATYNLSGPFLTMNFEEFYQ